MKLNFVYLGLTCLLSVLFLRCDKYESKKNSLSVQQTISPEQFIRQYQKWLDDNDFENAAKNATPEEKSRLDDLKNFVFKTPETQDSSLLQTVLLGIRCNSEKLHTVCHCKMKDQFEAYDITFYLMKSNHGWLMDAPPEKGQIYQQEEELQEIMDSIFMTMENKFQQ
jgi:hypothetical protein